MTELIHFDTAKHELMLARDIDEVKDIRDKAAALQAYLKQQGESREMQNAMGEIKLRAERRAGELLGELERNGGPGRGKKMLQDETSFSPYREALEENDLNRTAAHRFQKIASIPDPDFEQYLAETRASENGEVTSAGALRLAKKADRAQQRQENAELVQNTPPITAVLGVNRYSAIVIDPPWDWGDEGDVSQFGRGRPVYHTMPIEQIAELPIERLSCKNAHLYLWITNRSLPKGFQLMEAWGFRYITCITWCKPSIGMGNYFRGTTEHILFGVRGSLPLLRNDLGTWFEADRTGIHSGKPDDFYRTIETCSPGPWLEVFAREKRPGWASWGAEV